MTEVDPGYTCILTQMSNQRRRAVTAFARALPIDVFKALADPTRASLVAWLASRSGLSTVSQIVESGCCAVDFSVVSRHLQMLRDAGVLEAERHGREVHYRLRVESLVRTLRGLADAIETCCAPPTRPSCKE